jgi:hypothetical protein
MAVSSARWVSLLRNFSARAANSGSLVKAMSWKRENAAVVGGQAAQIGEQGEQGKGRHADS